MGTDLEQNSKTILIAGQFSYPSGMAASARIRNIAHGFRSNGYNVKVIALNSSIVGHKHGEYIDFEDVHFTFSSKKRKPSENFFQKWERITFPYKTMIKLLKEASKVDKIEGLFLFGESYFLLNPLIRWAKKMSIPVMLDIVELYEHMFSTKDLWKDPFLLDGYIGTKLLPAKVDMNLCITKALFKRFEGKASKTYLLPSVERTDNQRQELVLKNKSSRLIISYVGALFDRDAPDQIITLIKMLNDSDIDYTFQIIGKYNSHSVGRQYAEDIKKLSPERVFSFSGLSDEELLNKLDDSDVLFLPRRNGITEVYSFPTRLVEYLRTNALVIASSVGDIPIYLTHNEDSFLYEDLEKQATEIMNLLHDRSRIETLSRKNNDTISSHFDNVGHIKKIMAELNA